MQLLNYEDFQDVYMKSRLLLLLICMTSLTKTIVHKKCKNSAHASRSHELAVSVLSYDMHHI